MKKPEDLDRSRSVSGTPADSRASDMVRPDNLHADSPPKVKLQALKTAAEYFNSDVTSIVCSDDDGAVTSVSVHARGDEAVALQKWLKRRDLIRRTEDTASPLAPTETSNPPETPEVKP